MAIEENGLAISSAKEAVQGRKEPRYPAQAMVRLDESDLILSDISLSGGRIQSGNFLCLVPNGKYTIAIIPETESRIDCFEVDILSKWVRMKKTGSESGFIMVLPPDNNQMVEEYIDFLKYKMKSRPVQ